jgi:tetratricopeptide (TPR) repeat protein
MVTRPVIFVSAVSKELKSARQLVANTLHFLGYEPVWQDIFGSEQGDLRAVLRKKIDASQGVVHLVGQCYGAEPPAVEAPFGRVSYTQYEALYARQRGRKVWVLLLDETFAADPHGAEPDELRGLQAAYRERVRADPQLYHPLENSAAVEANVLKLRDELGELRRRGKQWAALVLALLAALAAGITWLAMGQKKQEQRSREHAQHDERTDAVLAQMRQMLESSVKGGSEAKLQQDYDAALRFVAERNSIEPPQLRALLQQNAARTLLDPKVALRDKVNALRDAGRFVEARDFAIKSARELAAERQHASVEEIQLWIEAASSEISLGHYPQAGEYTDKAVALADRDRDFISWAAAQHALGRIYLMQGKAKEAETLYRELVKLRTEKLGLDHPDTLKSWINLVVALDGEGKYIDAERENRAALAETERALGPEHSDTLKCRNNLANVLKDQGGYAEAEQEHRTVLAIRERVLGPEHPDTLASRNNLGSALESQGKYAEAEKEYRAVLVIRERVLAAEHPDTLRSRSHLANVLSDQGKHAEAEPEYRAVLAIQERVLGPEHPDTLVSRNNLASTLDSEGKHAEAEQEYRKVLAVRERVLGQEHPDVLSSRMEVANALDDQDKHAEAEQEYRAVLAIQERVLGQEHPDVFMSCYNLAWCLENQGKRKEALVYAQHAREGRKKALGEGHPDYKKSVELCERLEAAVAK